MIVQNATTSMVGDDPMDVLAIDGGGTRCRLAVTYQGRRTQVEVGSANVSTDLERTLDEIARGLAFLAKEADLDMTVLAELPAYAGISGVDDAAHGRRVAAQLPLSNVRVEDDGPAAVRGALGMDDGALAHCGTGSFQALQRSAHMRFAGGWGPKIGDQASAHWVAREALTAVLDAHDGLLARSDLTVAFERDLGSPYEIVAFATAASPSILAALAPRITAAATAGDPVAIDIMVRGAARLRATLLAIGWAPGMPLMLTGGLAPTYAPYLDPPLRAALATPKGEPIDGALVLAKAFARGTG